MTGQRINYGQPTGMYLLIEQLHAKSGLPSLANTVGASNLQIYRPLPNCMKLPISTSTINGSCLAR